MTDGYEEYDDVVVTEDERAMQDEIDAAIRISRQVTARQKSQYRYNHSDKGQKSKSKYQQTDKFRQSQRKYRYSPKGQEMLRKYSKSQNFTDAQEKYRHSEKGIENEQRKRQRKVASGKNAEYCKRYYYRKKAEMAIEQ